MNYIEALQLIATGPRPDGTWDRDREACRQIAAEALGFHNNGASMTTTTEALRLAREALRQLDEAFCADDYGTREGRDKGRKALVSARAAIAAIDALPAGEPAAAPAPAVQAEPVRDERATWWSLVMGAAASLENAAACLRDPDAKRAAEGAAKHYRERAQAGWDAATPQEAPAVQAEPVPIDMVLHCPACGLQHIDAPDADNEQTVQPLGVDRWTNPPHRSHLCDGCGHIWRPADVPTNGVAAVKTKGKADSQPASRAAPTAQPAPQASAPSGEPVATLWQHCETGRTRVTMPDQVWTQDATWDIVGPLYLHPSQGAANSQAILDGSSAEPVATLHDDGCFTWKRDEFRLKYDRQRAGWRMDVYTRPAQALPARLVLFTLRDLKAERKRLDGFVALGNEVGRAAEYDEWIAALETYAAAHGITATPQAAPAPLPLTDAARDVLAERQRQISAEGWTPEHDDKHHTGGMAVAAACYAAWSMPSRPASEVVATMWPWTGWAQQWFKPKDTRHNLIRAAALLLAEIERLDRAAGITATPAKEPGHE